MRPISSTGKPSLIQKRPMSISVSRDSPSSPSQLKLSPLILSREPSPGLDLKQKDDKYIEQLEDEILKLKEVIKAQKQFQDQVLNGKASN